MGEMKIFVLVCMLFLVYGADESIPKPTAADGPEFVEVEGERSPDDIDQELEAVYAVNQSEPLNLDEADEDISETDIDPNEDYSDEDEELVEFEVSPGDSENHTAVFAKNDKAPVDFDALREAEPEMIEEKATLSAGEEVDGAAVYAKNESAPINFDEAAPVDIKEFVEGKLPEDDTEKHEAIFEDDDDQVEDVEDLDTDMIQEEGEDSPKEEKPEYATDELPPLDLNE